MNKCFVVLGMHRSATSVVAGGLHRFVVNMGKDLLRAGKNNPLGKFENVEFVELNRKILQAAGGSWKNPPPENAIWDVFGDYKDYIEGVVHKYQHGSWGWKDPRTTLTIKLYLPYIENPHFVCCFRNPMRVAQSLKRRNNFPITMGLELAREYNRRLIGFLEHVTQRNDWTCESLV